MKRSKVDEILHTIDAGLQSTAEASYGETPYDGARPADSDRLCIRCDDPVGPDGEICPGCRTFLLGDTDTDPAQHPQQWAPADRIVLAAFAETVGESAESFAERVAELGRQLADILAPIVDIVLAFPDDVLDLISGRRPITDDEVARLEAALDALDTETETPVWIVQDDAFADLEEGTIFDLDGFAWLVDHVDHTTTPPTFHLIAPPDETEP